MKRSLSFDDIVAALAVLSVNVAAIGCSNRAPSSEKIAPATAPAVPAASVESTPAASGPVPLGAAPVDAGREVSPTPTQGARGIGKDKNPAASCGAQGCSPDMKKVGK